MSPPQLRARRCAALSLGPGHRHNIPNFRERAFPKRGWIGLEATSSSLARAARQKFLRPAGRGTLAQTVCSFGTLMTKNDTPRDTSHVHAGSLTPLRGGHKRLALAHSRPADLF